MSIQQMHCRRTSFHLGHGPQALCLPDTRSSTLTSAWTLAMQAHLLLLTGQAQEGLANGDADDAEGSQEEDQAAHSLKHAQLNACDSGSFATEQRQQAMG